MNPANLRPKIGTTMPRIVDLLSDKAEDVREATIKSLSKFAEHSKIGLLCCARY